MDNLTNEELRDIIKACDYAMRAINCFSEQFSRWNALEKKASQELRLRRTR